MSGRLLGGAVATVTGIAIGVATFDGEFKEQRRKRLENEYNREIAALKGATSPDNPEPTALKPIKSDKVPDRASQETPSKLSSLLGIWAWKRDSSSKPAPSQEAPPLHDTKDPRS